MNTQERIDMAVELLMPEAKKFIEMVNAKPMTTQNNYGLWMSIFSTFNDQPTIQQVLVLACIKAGGDEQGIRDGYKLATGREL